MTLTSFLSRLEARKLISRSPHPAIPFLIALAFLLLSRIPSPLSRVSFALFTLSLLFAVLHLIVVLLLQKSKSKSFKY